jgi:hypothetical protein
MKVHLVELFAQHTATLLAFAKWIITDFLQDFYDFLALFTLILIYRHWSLLAVEAVAFRYGRFLRYYNPAYLK